MLSKPQIDAKEQHKNDLLLVSAYQVAAKSKKEDSIVYDLLCKRAEEIKEKVERAIIETINMPELIFPELEHIEVEPGNCLCNDFPSRIFNYTDKLTLLNEGYALYLEEDDKWKLENTLEGIIHSGFACLSTIEKDILNYSCDFHECNAGMPWYEWDVLSHLLRGVDYTETMCKVDEYNEEGLWYEGYKLSHEELEENEQGGFSDIAGLDELKELLQSDFIDVMKEPERAEKLGLSLPNGMMLYGPPGCGKTAFATKFAEEAGCNFVLVNCSDIASSFLHGTQAKIANVFKEAEKKTPTIIFFDEIEAMIPKRGEHGNEYYQSETNEFLTQLNHCGKRGIFVIGATNRPQDIDEAALRSGRLDMKVYFPTPDKETRASLFIHYLKGKNIHGKINIDTLADKTEDYISADIKKIVELSARNAFRQKLDYVTMEMIEDVIKTFKPTVTKSTIKEHEAIRDKFESRKQERPRIGFC